jgi:4-hydroxyphenylacetate 3-monooxygenase/anthranilate 3-monooxygenase (FAD)/4-hydroxyphenylacetate 3-monooxygenase
MVRTGADYLASLNDDRKVWHRGELVADLSTAAPFQGCCDTLARLYDMQHAEPWRDVLSTVAPDGERIATSCLIPRTADDLARRHAAVRAWSDATFGFMGRTPDYVNSAVMAFASAHEWFEEERSEFGTHVRDYYELCVSQDLYVAHATINPQVHRLIELHKQPEPIAHLRVVDEVSDGLILRGAKLIGTSAPLADELLIFPMPGLVPGDEAFTAAFAVPTNSDGLTLICRDGFIGDREDAPLSAQFDEPDAICIFDDVLVPWNRVFSYGDVGRANVLWDMTDARTHTAHQGMIRTISKCELLVGIAIRLAEDAETNTALHVQEMLGEVIGYLDLVEGGVALAEVRAQKTRWGTLRPDPGPLQSLRYHFARFSGRLTEVIQRLGGASLLVVPGTMQTKETPSAIYPLFSGVEHEALGDRLRLLRLARNASTDSYGQRQALFEVYNGGDPVRLAANLYRSRPADRLRQIVDAAMGASSAG